MLRHDGGVFDILQSGALQLCTEEAEAAEKYKLAFRTAEGDWETKLLKEQIRRIKKHSKAIRKALERSGRYTSNIQVSQQPGVDLSVHQVPNIEDENDEADVPEYDYTDHQQVSQAHEKLKTLEWKTEELQKRMFRSQRELDTSGQQVRALTKNHEDKIGGLTTGDESMMKSALLKVARQVDPDATMAAETLGEFLMRTPSFFYQLHLIEWSWTGEEQDHNDHYSLLKQRSDGELKSALIGELKDYILRNEHFRVYESIDAKAREATHQGHYAICDLLCVLASSDLPASAHEHLVRVILELKENVARTDQQYKLDTSFKCAMVARWPDVTQGTSNVSNQKAYALMVRDIRKVIGGGPGRQITSKLSNAFTKNSTDDHNATSETIARRKISAIKGVLDENWTEQKKKDPLLHITAQVAEVLIAIANRGLSELRVELYNLYGSRLCDDVEKHWYDQRQAASRVCEIAGLGNEIALNTVCKHLLKEKHWMIRQVAVTEAARIVGKLPEDHPRLRELIDLLVRQCFDHHPDTDSKQSAPSDVELREAQNVQQATEAALIKELPTYKPKTQEYCCTIFKLAAEWFPATGRDRLERFRCELAITAPKFTGLQSSSTARTADRGGYSAGPQRDQTLRKARQRQMEAFRDSKN